MTSLVVCLLCAGNPVDPKPSPASDPHGIYALIEAVRLLPDAADPQRVELEGAFAIAAAPRGDRYGSPVWGKLLLTAAADDLDACVLQWRELAAHAGAGTVVGFSSRYSQIDVRVVSVTATDVPAGTMTPNSGVHAMSEDAHGPARDLRHLCRPIAPLGAVTVSEYWSRDKSGEIEFEFQNCRGSNDDTRYIVTVESECESRASPLLVPGERVTKWKVRLALAKGDDLRWSVIALGPAGGTTPIAKASFTIDAVQAGR